MVSKVANMKKILFLSCLSTFSLQLVHAENQKLTYEQVAQVRALLPVGSDIAQTAIARMSEGNSKYDLETASANTIIRDFDGNGALDFAVIVEVNPKLLIDNDENQPCEKIDYEKNCYMVYGKRKLSIYMNGSNIPFTENTQIVLNAEDGGVFGDPLVGLSLNKRGSLMLDFYGGSSWRWGQSYTIQHRINNFYLVGLSSSYGWVGDGREDTSDYNLLTGLEIKTSKKEFESPVKTIRMRHKLKPLVLLQNITEQLD